jgi:hypothetical protein
MRNASLESPVIMLKWREPFRFCRAWRSRKDAKMPRGEKRLPKARRRRSDASVGWGFAILAAVVIVILIGWSFGGNGHGWGRRNQLAHMMPPAPEPASGPATRSWTPPNH